MSAASVSAMKIAVGPLLFGWPEIKIRDACLALAEQPDVDIIYVGEVVCSKRSISGTGWRVDLAREMQDSGKEVVLSTLAMPTTEAELQDIRDLAAAAGELGLRIEANDIAAVAIASDLGVEFVAGPHLNVYSHGSLEQLRRHGARRVVLPPELPARSISAVIGDSDVEVEYFVHGKIPLTFSARCYTARAWGLNKRDCSHVCFRDQDGMDMHTLDGMDFATINGIQIMSHLPFTAIDHVPELAGVGVNVLRLSLQATGMSGLVRSFRSVMDGITAADDALQALSNGKPAEDMFCNGYYHGRQGRCWVES